MRRNEPSPKSRTRANDRKRRPACQKLRPRQGEPSRRSLLSPRRRVPPPKLQTQSIDRKQKPNWRKLGPRQGGSSWRPLRSTRRSAPPPKSQTQSIDRKRKPVCVRRWPRLGGSPRRVELRRVLVLRKPWPSTTLLSPLPPKKLIAKLLGKAPVPSENTIRRECL